MNSIPFRMSAVAVLTLGTCASALAQGYQSYGQPAPQDQAQYEQQLQQYQDRQQEYQNQKNAYDNRAADYRSRKDSYDAQRDNYAAQREGYAYDRSAYEQQRADYDARYGAGAWERRYGYSSGYRTSNGYDYSRSRPCEQRASSGAVAGGLLGAIAGAAIGSSIAGRGNHTTGAVLGGVAGGAIGASVGSSSARCDTTGYYYSYNDTYPYSVADRDDGRYGYGYYRQHRCRLAIAPAYVDGSTEDRYVRVCPDSYGRYRITP